jgi:hypothetical protein
LGAGLHDLEGHFGDPRLGRNGWAVGSHDARRQEPLIGKGRMRTTTTTLFALLLATAGACSSSTDGGRTAADGGTGGSNGTGGDTSGTGGNTNGTGGSPAATGGAAGTTETGDMSPECKEYCDCYESDCAAIQAIPSGQSCGDFCKTFTHEIWDCRRSHCELAVPEMNPHHCWHAVGIEQCE